MRILLLSNSARGHAIADALARSRHVPDIIAVSTTKNPGLSQLCIEQHVASMTDIDRIMKVAEATKPDFAVIAPEDPLGAGVVDRLASIGIPSVGPMQKLAQIETSKGFTRQLLEKHNIDVSPKVRIIDRAASSMSAYEERTTIAAYLSDKLGGEYVVKYDGLKGGKGVLLSGEHLHSIDEGVAYAMECLEEGGRVVIEEKLVGVEFSLMAFVSGTQVVNMPAVQDHKRAYEGDTGPNTGGMGTYSDADHSLPFLTDADLMAAQDINQKVAEALLRECSEPYKGILYGGFIAVKDGVRLIEYNARFGDPEALNVLPILESDFADLCQGIIDGTLTEGMARFAHKATVCKYITPTGYPENKDQKDQSVHFPAMPENARIFYGDVSQSDDGTILLGGSRAAGIVGTGDTIAEAERIAESLCAQVEGPVRYRKDIGTAQLLSERTRIMRQLRP